MNLLQAQSAESRIQEAMDSLWQRSKLLYLSNLCAIVSPASEGAGWRDYLYHECVRLVKCGVYSDGHDGEEDSRV